MSFARAMRVGPRLFHTSARRMAAEESAVAENLRLNLAVPHTSLIADAEVKRVTLPGRGGSYGVQKDSPATLSELRPGVVRVDYLDNNSEELFIPGGFAFTHPNNRLDVTVPEGVRLSDIDTDRLREQHQQAQSRKDAAGENSKEGAEAAIQVEVYKALGQALNVTL